MTTMSTTAAETPTPPPAAPAVGKKEIAMMIPVVFLVLPVTVLFAIYPGIAFLRFTI